MEKVLDGVKITSRGLSVFVESELEIIEIKPNESLDGFISVVAIGECDIGGESYSSLEEAVDDARSILQ